MAKNRLPGISLSEATGGKPEHALRYRELLVPRGLQHELRGVFALDGKLWGCITTMRERNDSDFDVREVALFGRIAPHLAAGLKAAALYSDALAEPAQDNAPGVLVVDPLGRVVQHTRAAERWLRDLVDLSPGWQEGKDLPSAVLAVVGALRQALGPDTD
jgi:hypothetical protein